jgi:methylated-DNA-[protein]-cysteine S-methyltransferase
MTPISAFYKNVETPLGIIVISADSNGNLLTLDFSKSPIPLPWLRFQKAAGQCKKAIKEITEYFTGKRKTFTVTCRFPGATVFQINVWNTLSTIPYGTTVSYSDIALWVGKPKAYRAVGNAIGENRVPIIIPCHRVILKSGSLGGFGPGPDKKRALLALENRITTHVD